MLGLQTQSAYRIVLMGIEPCTEQNQIGLELPSKRFRLSCKLIEKALRAGLCADGNIDRGA